MVAFRLLGPDLARMSMEAGDIDRARRVADQVEEHAHRARVPSAEGAALQCRGLVDDSPRLLEEAVAAYRRSPRIVHLAFAREDAGASLARNGQVDDGAARLLEALDTYERAGMRRDARRTEGLLRSVGIKRGARGRRQRPRRGWASLTGTEERVASLAAEGLTNPQIAERLFISRRTVETHMSHVLAKVGLGSRVELAAEVARRAT
jgi:DNA-binding CsgD family transcriptional regulator